MKLNDIIVSALAQLGRENDPQTLKRFTLYANDAQNDLAEAVRLYRTDRVLPVNGAVDLGRLSRSCIKVLKVVQMGHPVGFIRADSSNTILLPCDSPAVITYRCRPKPFVKSTDVSELDESLQGLIVNYVVGRERMAGDTSTQRGGKIHLAMYEAAKAKLIRNIGDAESYKLINRF